MISSELDKIKVRFAQSAANDIWVYRKEPPKDWNKPLPEWIQKRYQNSYLNEIQKRMEKNEKDNQ